MTTPGSSETIRFDVLVIGSGPAGQKAAVQSVKAGRRVAMVEQEPGVGGMCVHRGTIPSKTLRESAWQLSRLRRSSAMLDFTFKPGLEVASLMARLDEVVGAHVAYMGRQMARNGIHVFHGRAHFLSNRLIEVQSVDGSVRRLGGDTIFIATGSRPRTPAEIPVDHENILDSDSILSMLYLPASLTVLGGGVIACEYASIFAHLGVQVTMIDRADRPLKFMDAELVGKLVDDFERTGGRFLGERTVGSVEWDGASKVITRLATGEVIESDKMLVALGRAAAVEGLDLPAAGLRANARGLLEVDAHCRTVVPHIYAIGDVIGPPSLAATAMEQGRRAACHSLGLAPGSAAEMIPIGIYTIPEMASVGLSEDDAAKRFRGTPVMVGRGRFDEIARGQISGVQDGLLKLVADPSGTKLLGVHIVGEGATELIHLGQMALLAGTGVDAFIENIFNFPTLAEAYRVAALDILEKRR
ncbi:MAG TPA: Si-specific NAD(P)(+) transhydrogenase [Polyangia bacterium]|jgi:NAD(P) transhydrogenase|nr:Si-specific NAD(P)(+) transhydrogenase [Polyangia bacterium]